LAKKLPLEGIRVTDFSWVGAGPLTTRYLSEFGAEVIRIETKKRPEILRLAPPYKDRRPGIERSGYYSNRNPNKKSISLNMSHSKARDVVVGMLKKSDLVINSFTLGQMDKWNLSYEEVKKIKPDIIYIDMPAQGNVGPHADYMGFGLVLNALIGANYLSGFPDGEPFGTGTNYTDHVPVPTHLVFAILAALRYRRKTGEGQYIEIAQSQAGVRALSALAVMDYAVNGRIQNRIGNRHPDAAPHGVYKTRGSRQWIAIAVFSDQEWEALKKCMGNPQWAEDQKFATKEARLANQDELDTKIEEWTSGQYNKILMLELLKNGVRAGAVYNVHDAIEDDQLQERGFWVYMDHPEAGLTLYNHSPMRMTKTPPLLSTPAPLLGQHTQEVLKGLLQISDEEINQLEAEGVLE